MGFEAVEPLFERNSRLFVIFLVFGEGLLAIGDNNSSLNHEYNKW